MPITPRSVAITDQLTRALGEAVIGLGSNLPQDVQDRLFKEVVLSGQIHKIATFRFPAR